MEHYIQLEEMEYKQKREEYPVLCYGTHKGRYFFIVNVGGEYPAAYVEAKKEEPLNCRLLDPEISKESKPHGGLTYGPGNLLRLKKSLRGYGVSEEVLARRYWGWDYGHIGDCCTWMENHEEYSDDPLKKWTVGEIYEEDVVPLVDWLAGKYVSVGENENDF